MVSRVTKKEMFSQEKIIHRKKKLNFNAVMRAKEIKNNLNFLLIKLAQKYIKSKEIKILQSSKAE